MAISLSYPILVILFSGLVGVLVFILLQKSNPHIEYRKALNSRFVALGVLFLIIGPVTFYDLQAYGKFGGPDCLLYIKDSNLITQVGHIPTIEELAEDSYYLQFPIFTLIVNTISQVLGVPSTMAMYVADVLIQLLFWMSIWILFIKIRLGGENTIVSMIIAAFASPYLYGYLGMPIPQTLGLSVLIMLLWCVLQKVTIGKGKGVIFIMLSLLGLVHVGVIPFFLAALILISIVQSVSHIHTDHRFYSLVTISIPLVTFAAFLAFSYALGRVVDYAKVIVGFLFALQSLLLRGNANVSQGTVRLFVPLNALASAFIIGVILAILAWYLLERRRKCETINSFYVGFALISFLAIGMGSLRERFDLSEFGGSISRYFALPGYALAVIGTLFALNALILPFILDKSRRLSLRIFLAALIVLIVVGGLLDPLAFPNLRFPV